VGFADRAIVFVGQQEEILGALAEGGDARIVNAQAVLAKYLRDLGQQAGPGGAGQAQAPTPHLLGAGQVHPPPHR